MSYVPAAKFGIKYLPLPSVTAVRMVSVPTCRVVIVAPGTTAPCASVTTPRAPAKAVWAVAGRLIRLRPTVTVKTNLYIIISTLLHVLS